MSRAPLQCFRCPIFHDRLLELFSLRVRNMLVSLGDAWISIIATSLQLLGSTLTIVVCWSWIQTG